MADNVRAFEEAVRKRPTMFIGNDGVTGLLIGLLANCLELCKTDKILIEVTIAADNDFMISFSTAGDVSSFLSAFDAQPEKITHYFPRVLTCLAERFEIREMENPTIQLLFAVDQRFIADTAADYIKLSEKVFQLALLNRHCEILTVDKRKKYTEQNYYHFPQGILYLFDRAIKDALGTPTLNIRFEGLISSNSYQIGLAYRSDWFPQPQLLSFADNVHTVDGGSLVDGIIDGLIAACKIYVKKNSLKTYKISRKKFMNGLILLCAVRGDEFIYGGSWKETLENEDVYKDAKALTTRLVLEFLNSDSEKAQSFLWRFDTTQLTHFMFS